MPHITLEAGLAVNRLVEGRDAAGLRTWARRGEARFAMSIVTLPTTRSRW